MADYRLSRTADRKLEAIYEYSLKTFGEATADGYFLGLHEAFALLAENPAMGRRFKDYRRHEHASHVIFYKPLSDGVLILDVLHRREDAGKLP